LAAARSFQETRLASLETVAEKVEPGFDFHEIEDLCGRYRKKVNCPRLKAGASSFTGGCLSNNVLSRSYAASTGCTPGPRGRPVRRQTPLPKQLRRIVANVAPYIPSLKGRGYKLGFAHSCGVAEGIDQAVNQGCWDFVCGRILG
jgi:hypothetical protein